MAAVEDRHDNDPLWLFLLYFFNFYFYSFVCRCGFLGFFSGSVFRAAPRGGVKQNLVSCIRCCVVVEDRLCSVSIVSRRLSCHFCFLLFFYFVVLFLFVFFFLSINFNRNGVFLFLDFSIFLIMPSNNRHHQDDAYLCFSRWMPGY